MLRLLAVLSLSLWIALPCVASQPAPKPKPKPAPAPEAPPVPLDDFLTQAPPCPSSATRCVGIVLHVVVKDGAPVASAEWFAGQLSKANDLFAALDVGFTLKEARALPDTVADIVTRAERDKLGKKREVKGFANVFLVSSLADVDVEGALLNGVHWRNRDDKSHRWIILASTAWELTLAHELGHFFSLPHSTYEESIMNKTPRAIPPEERIFAEAEVKQMKKEVARLFSSKELKKP